MTLEIISLGAGVQSSVMALMAARGELTPLPSAAVFADTQWEPAGVYAHLDWLEQQLPFPVYRVTQGDLRADALSAGRSASMPFHVLNPDGTKGFARRQCTSEYKLRPLRQKMRELAGLAKGQRSKGIAVISWIGISTDEAIRMKPSFDKWCENRWPLIEKRMSRGDCLAWFNRHYPGRTLAKSSCIGCPYHSNEHWRALKQTDEWHDAVEFDRLSRTNERMRGQLFLHSSLVPLDEADLEHENQLDLFGNDCEGMCGV